MCGTLRKLDSGNGVFLYGSTCSFKRPFICEKGDCTRIRDANIAVVICIVRIHKEHKVEHSEVRWCGGISFTIIYSCNYSTCAACTPSTMLTPVANDTAMTTDTKQMTVTLKTDGTTVVTAEGMSSMKMSHGKSETSATTDTTELAVTLKTTNATVIITKDISTVQMRNGSSDTTVQGEQNGELTAKHRTQPRSLNFLNSLTQLL